MTKEEAIKRVKTRFDKWALDNEDLTALQVLGLVDAESKDERIRKAALEGIEYLEHKLGWDFIGDTDILDVKEYLERQKEQKSAEWSEEEIRAIFNDYAECKDTYISCINRLKSLRPKPAWKPSEEQMQYLLAVINDPNNIGAESCYMTIKSLYNDLKKL